MNFFFLKYSIWNIKKYEEYIMARELASFFLVAARFAHEPNTPQDYFNDDLA